MFSYTVFMPIKFLCGRYDYSILRETDQGFEAGEDEGGGRQLSL